MSRAPEHPSRLMALILALHRRLLPARPEIGWTPYLWLCYLGFFAFPWFFRTPSGETLAWAAVSLVVFLALYFNGHWRGGLDLLWNIAGLVILALLWIPFNASALVFFIFAAGFTGAVGPPKIGRRVLIGISVIVLTCGLLLELPVYWSLMSLTFCWIVGATNIYFAEMSRKNAHLRRTREEAEHLATIAERERIARDLHDILGHTLSLITMKAELARKLSDRGDARAGEEIAEVEQISRDALRQVREAVEGYRQTGLAGEVARARIVCQTRGIELDARMAPLPLETRQEAALALVLREAVTNVARHSAANRCEITLTEEATSQGSRAVLRVVDDGKGGRHHGTGNGLTGMEERLSRLGGELHVDGQHGWKLEAGLPIPAIDATERAVEFPTWATEGAGRVRSLG